MVRSTDGAPTRVYLEQGRTWQFAVAVDWPGWCRRGKREDDALEALTDYSDRYAAVVGADFRPGPLVVIGRVAGSATTDFGAPGVPGPWDEEPLTGAEAQRQVSLLIACWDAFDRAVERAPAELPRGPRGGGRDRQTIVDHVREAERAYCPKLGLRVPPRTDWARQRAEVAAVLRHPDYHGAWPARYALRRLAWHVLDHAWELEDKTP